MSQLVHLNIKDVFAFSRLDLELPLGKPLLITGRNSSGKTGLARILAALTSGTSNPAGVSAAHMKHYVRDGAAEGYAALGEFVWQPPQGVTIPTGEKPQASPYAVGLVNFLVNSRTKADRARVWEHLFLPKDARAILEPKWQQSPQQLLAVLEQIEKDGWESASAIFKNQKLQFRRTWEEVTGERFGLKKAAQWKPKDWSVDLEGLSEDDVLNSVTEASEALRALTMRGAVSQDRINRAIEMQKDLPEAESKLMKIEEAHQSSFENRKKVLKSMNAAKMEIEKSEKCIQVILREVNVIKEAFQSAQSMKPDAICPSCNAKLMFSQPEGVVLFKDQDLVEMKENANKKLLELKKDHSEQEAVLAQNERVYNRFKADLKQIEQDLDKTLDERAQQRALVRSIKNEAEYAHRQPQTDDINALISEQENKLAEAKTRLKAWQDNRNAQRAFDNYTEKETVEKLLGPDGAKAELMAFYMQHINKLLVALSKRTGWLPVIVTRTYEVLSNGRPAFDAFCAKNERQKAQWMLQAACAMPIPRIQGYDLQGADHASQWLIFDEADILRGDSWDGLVAMSDALMSKIPGLQVVVCATETAAPDGWNVVNLSEGGAK